MGYYINNLGVRVELFNEHLYLQNMDLVELALPENCIYCEVQNNKLTKLIVNSKCKKLWCASNELTELILPESCTYCNCSKNNLTKLITNQLCKYLDCHNNKLTELALTEKCKYGDISGNKFSQFMDKLIRMNRKLSNQIFEMEECKLKSMLLSSDEETFELGLEILKKL